MGWQNRARAEPWAGRTVGRQNHAPAEPWAIRGHSCRGGSQRELRASGAAEPVGLQLGQCRKREFTFQHKGLICITVLSPPQRLVNGPLEMVPVRRRTADWGALCSTRPHRCKSGVIPFGRGTGGDYLLGRELIPKRKGGGQSHVGPSAKALSGRTCP